MDFSSSEYAVKAKHARSGLIWLGQYRFPSALTRSFRLRNLGVGRLILVWISEVYNNST
nr:MAG TPA: hypothetical protein [Caudoviricetes sp.]